MFLAYAAELGVLAALAWIACLLAVAVGAGCAGAARRTSTCGAPGWSPWRSGWVVVANFTPMGYAFCHSLLWLWPGICWSRT